MILTLKSNVSSGCRAFTVRLTVQCAAALLLLSGDVIALEPAHDISQYGHTAWTRQNGGPQAGVFALAQTSDGDLWVGTEFGLFHFDGARLLPWQPPHGPQLANEHILALAASQNGSLWIGTKQGLLHWDGNRIERNQTSKGTTGPSVVSILVDRAGIVWAGTAGYRCGGLCRVEGNSLRCDQTNEGLAGSGI